MSFPASTHADSSLLRPVWQSVFRNRLIFGLFLILSWGMLRFWVVLQANVTGSYQWVSMIFVSMWIAPFLFLTRSGRQQIGITRPRRGSWLLIGFVLGALSAICLYWMGNTLYGTTDQHWFVYIARTFANVPSGPGADERWIYFAIYTLIGMTFSPIGEELFYRGMVHESFVPRYGDRIASYLDSAAFSVTHLAHFGIVYLNGRWEWLVLPSLLWVLLLFGLCQLFFLARKKSASILGAIGCHAGFNAAMNYTIIFHIL